MRKILSLCLALVLILSMAPAAFAAVWGCTFCGNVNLATCPLCSASYCPDCGFNACDCNATLSSNGTQVEYNADDRDGDGQLDNLSYTITVPALLAPGGSGTVTLQGMWPSNATVKVTAENKVEMVNNINNADKKELAVTFANIEKAGSNTAIITASAPVSVANIENALFGTWSGKFNYYVEMIEEEVTTPMLMMFRYSHVTPDNSDFSLYDETFSFESSMTWGEFIKSEYNANDIFWTDGTYIYYGEEIETAEDGYLLAAGSDKNNPETPDKEIIENQVYYADEAPIDDEIPEQEPTPDDGEI